MQRRLQLLVALSIVLLALPAMASNFRAADVVYLNAAGRLVGNNAFFKTDVTITNVSNAAVEVDVVALTTGGGDARAGLDNPVRVGTLQAGESIQIDDIVQTTLGLDGFFGQMIFFSCAVGGDCSSCDTNAADCLPIVVESRIYDEAVESNTTGQLFPGNPWYSFVSSSVADRDLDEVWITGIRENAEFRSNLGFANASEFSSTTLNVTLHESNGNMTTTQVTLGPLGHTQQNISALFPGFSGEAYVVVSQPASGVVPTNPDDPDPFIASGAPGFYAYGSVLDNNTNDPTTLEAVYPVEFDFQAVYGKAGVTGRPVSRPSSE